MLQAAILSLQLDRRLGDEAEVDVAGGESRVRRDETAAQPRHAMRQYSALSEVSVLPVAACHVFNGPEKITFSEASSAEARCQNEKPDVRTF